MQSSDGQFHKGGVGGKYFLVRETLTVGSRTDLCRLHFVIER